MQPCQLARLPDDPTLADLEIAYALRGAELLVCDSRRALAVDIHAAEHADEDAWRAALTPVPSFWRRLLGRR